MARGRPVAATAVAVAVMLGACSGQAEDTTGAARTEAQAVLDRRPDLAQAMAGYTTLLQEVRDQVDETAGTQTWETIGADSGGVCLEFGAALADLDAVTGSTPAYATTPIPEDRWAATLEAVRTLLADQGFEGEEVRADATGDHDVRLKGPDGASLQVASRDSTLVSLTSGCHKMPEEGSPFQTPAIPTTAPS